MNTVRTCGPKEAKKECLKTKGQCYCSTEMCNTVTSLDETDDSNNGGLNTETNDDTNQKSTAQKDILSVLFIYINLLHISSMYFY